MGFLWLSSLVFGQALHKLHSRGPLLTSCKWALWYPLLSSVVFLSRFFWKASCRFLHILGKGSFSPWVRTLLHVCTSGVAKQCIFFEWILYTVTSKLHINIAILINCTPVNRNWLYKGPYSFLVAGMQGAISHSENTVVDTIMAFVQFQITE